MNSDTDRYESQKKFIVNILFYATVAVIGYLLFKYAIPYFLPFIMAFCLVTLVNPLTRTINKRLKKKNPIITFLLVAIVYIIVGGLLTLLVITLISGGIRSASYISQTYYPDVLKPALTLFWDNLSNYVSELPEFWQNIILSAQNNIMQGLQSFALGLVPSIMRLISSIIGSVPSFLISLLFTVMLSFFISLHYEKVLVFFRSLLPEKATDFFIDLRSVIGGSVGRYFGALFIIMGITFVELSIGLTILRVDNVFYLAVIIALLDILPVLGTGSVLIPWTIISLFQKDFSRAGGLLILYVTITIIRNIIEPKIVGDRLGINPIVSIVAIYFGFKAFGVLGMILMPVTVHIVLELNRKGTIKLFKPFPNEKVPPTVKEGEGGNSAEEPLVPEDASGSSASVDGDNSSPFPDSDSHPNPLDKSADVKVKDVADDKKDRFKFK